MRSKIQWLRRAVQVAVLVAMLGLPVLVEFRVLLARNQLEAVRNQERETAPGKVILGVEQMIGPSATAGDLTARNARLVGTLGRVQGNPWSAHAFGLSWTDPLATLESMAASRRITVALLAALLLPVVLTRVLGRVFCSWICPAGLLFDVADRIRSRIPTARFGSRDVHFWRGHKYVLLVSGLIVGFFVGMPVLGYFYPPALLGREIGFGAQAFFEGLGTSSNGGAGLAVTGGALLLGILVLVEVFLSRRMWCRYACPGGALYSALGTRPVMRLHNDSRICTGCAECVAACPMALNPMRNQFGPECDLCLECRTACQPGAIRFHLGRDRYRPAPSGKEAA